jgi:hypothetical protein
MRCPQPHATTSVATDLRRGGKYQRYGTHLMRFFDLKQPLGRRHTSQF